MLTPDDSRNGCTTDRWFVTNGIVAVGPVSYELVLRGVAYGRIPVGSFVRHESWQVWRRLEDIDAQSASSRRQIIADLAQHSAAVEKQAPSAFSVPPPPPTGAELSSRTENIDRAARQSFRPAAVSRCAMPSWRHSRMAAPIWAQP